MDPVMFNSNDYPFKVVKRLLISPYILEQEAKEK
jgi:hypothetical protein